MPVNRERLRVVDGKGGVFAAQTVHRNMNDLGVMSAARQRGAVAVGQDALTQKYLRESIAKWSPEYKAVYAALELFQRIQIARVRIHLRQR